MATESLRRGDWHAAPHTVNDNLSKMQREARLVGITIMATWPKRGSTQQVYNQTHDHYRGHRRRCMTAHTTKSHGERQGVMEQRAEGWLDERRGGATYG